MGGTDALTRWELGVSAVDSLLQAERSDPGAPQYRADTRSASGRNFSSWPTVLESACRRNRDSRLCTGVNTVFSSNLPGIEQRSLDGPKDRLAQSLRPSVTEQLDGKRLAREELGSSVP